MIAEEPVLDILDSLHQSIIEHNHFHERIIQSSLITSIHPVKLAHLDLHHLVF